jgi:hypothetical protein
VPPILVCTSPLPLSPSPRPLTPPHAGVPLRQRALQPVRGAHHQEQWHARKEGAAGAAATTASFRHPTPNPQLASPAGT